MPPAPPARHRRLGALACGRHGARDCRRAVRPLPARRQSLGAEVAESIATPGVSEGLVLGPLLAAAVAGATLAVAAPARSTLGNQIAAGPAGAVVAVIALVLVPVIAGSVIVVPSLVAVCVGLAGALSVGMAPGSRSRRRHSLPFRPAPSSPKARSEPVGGSTAARWLFWLGRWAGLPWGSLSELPRSGRLRSCRQRFAVQAPPGSLSPCRVPSGRARCRLGRTCRHPGRAAVAKASGRPPGSTPPAAADCGSRAARAEGDLRLATLGATVFGLAGAALAAATDAPPPAPFLLGTTTALLGSLLCPLVVGGALDDGRWLWRSAPVRNGAIARSFALSSTVGSRLAGHRRRRRRSGGLGWGRGNPRRRRSARRRRLGRGTARRRGSSPGGAREPEIR